MAAAAIVVLLVCSLPSLLVCSLPSLLVGAAAAGGGEKQSYVVYLGEHAHGERLGAAAAADVDVEALARQAEDSHCELLAGVLGDKEKAREAIFYSYTRHINGFAANLDAAAAAKIAGELLHLRRRRRRRRPLVR
jgi:hypothetical protein